MAATIKQIAELAGVSNGTVDRVLHNRGKVKPEVEKRVRSIAQALDYRPNLLAKSLVMQRNPITIGVILHVDSTFSNYTIQKVLEGIQAASEEIEKFGTRVRVEYGQNFDSEYQAEMIDKMVSEGIQALVIMPINSHQVREKIGSLGIPVFCVTNDIPKEYPHYFVGIDGNKIGEIAAGLFRMIHKDLKYIGIVTASQSLMGNSQRLQAFQERVQEYFGRDVTQVVLEAANDDFVSYQKIYQMLLDNPRMDSLFFMSGAAESGMRAIEETGFLGKLCIITIDSPSAIRKGLLNGTIAATIDQRAYTQGYQTIRYLFDYFTNGVLPEQKQIYIDSDILIRESISLRREN